VNPSQQPSLRVQHFSGPLAFLADVHGNLPALDAVIAACREAGASSFFVAGDLVFRGDQPLEVWKRLVEIGAHCTRGASDLALAAIDPEKLAPKTEVEIEAAERFRKTRTALGELILARLRRLPDVLRIELGDGDEIAMMHGSPVDPLEPITHDLNEEEVSALLGTDPADVVVCGGSHVPFLHEVGGIRVVGVGSVGEAATDSHGARVAHYALIAPSNDGLVIERRWVTY
jgi:predicted phosphodiesterase